MSLFLQDGLNGATACTWDQMSDHCAILSPFSVSICTKLLAVVKSTPLVITLNETSEPGITDSTLSQQTLLLSCCFNNVYHLLSNLTLADLCFGLKKFSQFIFFYFQA